MCYRPKEVEGLVLSASRTVAPSQSELQTLYMANWATWPSQHIPMYKVISLTFPHSRHNLFRTFM
jgi:hypothetical protein